MMSVLMCTRSTNQVTVSVLALFLVAGAICSDIASAARLLPEDHDFSISYMTADPAAYDLSLNTVADGSSSQRPELHSEVAGSDNPCDGFENMLDRPGGLNPINAGTAEISFQRKSVYTSTRSPASSEYKKIAEGLVFNALPKGHTTPSGPGHKGNGRITEQRLWTSKHSPGVGHMQKISKRNLGSVPSPGVGN